jgi:ABC-2 type transport system permease protein
LAVFKNCQAINDEWTKTRCGGNAVMNMMMTIAQREFNNLFLSPLAWSILAVLQFIFAYLFFSQVDAFIKFQAKLASIANAPGITDVVITPLFANVGIILLLVIPLLTMRLICTERRNKTLTLLLSAPISNRDIILGKYLGVLGLLIVIIGLISLMPLSLIMGTQLDFGKFFSNILALILLVAAFSAVGLYMSCIAGHPTIAAISSFGLLLLLWILNASSGIRAETSALFEYLSILKHFQALQTGLINSTDLSYFVLFTATFLLLSIRRLDNDRLQK